MFLSLNNITAFLIDLLIALAIFALPYYLIFKINAKPKKRHIQYTFPLVALILAIVTIYFHNNIIAHILNFKGPLIEFFEQQNLNFLANFFKNHTAKINYFLSIIYVYAFLLIKLFVKFSSVSFVGANFLPKFSIAYTKNDKEQIALKKEFVFAKLVTYRLALALVILHALFIILFEFNIEELPFFIVLTSLLFLELYWYFNYKAETEDLTSRTIEDDDENTKGLKPLWKSYKSIWPSELINSKEIRSKQSEPTSIEDSEALSIEHLGYTLTKTDEDLLIQLRNKFDVLVSNTIADEKAPILFSHFTKLLFKGNHILILTKEKVANTSAYNDELKQWLVRWIDTFSVGEGFWPVQILDRLHHIDLTTKILVASPEDLLEKDLLSNQWFNNLSCVFFFEGHKIFEHQLHYSHTLIEILKNKLEHLQLLFFSDFIEGIEPSVKWNLNVSKNFVEIKDFNKPQGNNYAHIWKNDNAIAFQNAVLKGHIERNLGEEALLVLPAAHKEELIYLVNQDKISWVEELQELDNQKSILSLPTIDKKYALSVNGQFNDALVSPKDRVVLIANDNINNYPAVLKKWQSFSKEETLTLITSSSYLLRDYFSAHFNYFTETPVYPLAPKLLDNEYNTALLLLNKLLITKVPYSALKDYILRLYPNSVSITNGLHKLFLETLNIDIITSNYLFNEKTSWFDVDKQAYFKETLYFFSPSIKEHINLKFLNDVSIIDQAGNILKEESYDFVFQNYLPNQTHTFGGKSYTIREFDNQSNTLKVSFTEHSQKEIYRIKSQVVIHSMQQVLQPLYKENILSKTALNLYKANFNVNVLGYFTFKNKIDTYQASYTPLQHQEGLQRHYKYGKLLSFEFNLKNNTISKEVANTLVIVLKELFYTLFPNSHQYICVTSPQCLLSTTEEEFSFLFTDINITQGLINDDGNIAIYIVEDANQDLGLIQVIYDRWEYIFRLIDDYLEWCIENPIDKNHFLTYGTSDLPKLFNLKQSHSLLKSILGDNIITQRRKNS